MKTVHYFFFSGLCCSHRKTISDQLDIWLAEDGQNEVEDAADPDGGKDLDAIIYGMEDDEWETNVGDEEKQITVCLPGLDEDLEYSEFRKRKPESSMELEKR